MIWERQFPWNQSKGFLNPAKANANCKAGSIQIYSQMPFSAFTYVQTFRWQNQQLSYIADRNEDRSAETVERLIEQTTEGQDIVFSEETFGIFYPHRYIYADKLAEAIARGHKIALALYAQGNPKAAAQRLEKMFNLTVKLTEIVGSSSASLPPQQWVESWKEIEMTPQSYVAALNDYDFFLQEIGDHRQAIPIFKMAIAADQNRSVAYLNLADSLWAQGNRAEATKNYQSYQLLMKKAQQLSNMPNRVSERLSY